MLNLTLPQKSVRRTVALPPDFWEVAKLLGEGNATLGLKRALKMMYAIRTKNHQTATLELLNALVTATE